MATEYSHGGEVLNVKGESLNHYLERKKSELILNQFALIKKYFPLKNTLLLEFGCFHGLLSEMINNETRAKCFGIDINVIRKKKYLIEYDGEKIPFKNNYFDGIIAFEVVEHLKDDVKAFSEINRVLKKGGVGIVSTPNKLMISSLTSGHNSLKGHLKQLFHINQECTKMYSYWDLKNLFEKSGFSFKLIGDKPFWIKRGFIFLIKKERDL